jgi:hypothetical protein
VAKAPAAGPERQYETITGEIMPILKIFCLNRQFIPDQYVMEFESTAAIHAHRSCTVGGCRGTEIDDGRRPPCSSAVRDDGSAMRRRSRGPRSATASARDTAPVQAARPARLV